MAKFLGTVYAARTPDEVRSLYDAWAETYDAEIAEAGYATPARVAAALTASGADRAAPVLDFGCGTGLSGAALKLVGFREIDGADISPEMLARAKAKGVYRRLLRLNPKGPLPSGYATVAAVGVIGPGAAPLSVLPGLASGLPRGGLFGFSFNDHALTLPDHVAAIPALVEAGVARVAFEERGEHLPGIAVKSTVYVLERM
jgi:predicted TPR repeat methyltransferase